MVNSKQLATLNLYDLTGKQVYHADIPPGNSERSIKRLQAGLYIYKVWVNDELKQTNKIVKVE